MSGEWVLAVIAGQVLFMVLVCRAVFRLGRTAERQDSYVVEVLVGAAVSDEAERQETT